MGQPTYIPKTQLLKTKDSEINVKRTVRMESINHV